MRPAALLLPLFLCLAPFSGASALLAQAEVADGAAEETYPKLRLSGVLWGAWSMDLTRANPEAPNPNGANRFEVTRTYLNFEADVTKKISLRITPDLVIASDEDGNIDGSKLLRLKYAYATFSDVAPGASLRVLMQATPYIGFSDGIWGYRVLGVDYLELFTGVSSSDLGVAALGNVPGRVLEYQVLLSNGEGYSKIESTARNAAKYKDVAGRFTVAPFVNGPSLVQKLRLTGFAQYGIREKADHHDAIRGRALGLLTWQTPISTLGVGGGMSWDDLVEESEGGISVERQRAFLFTSWGWLDLPLNLRAIGRFDLFDPQEEPAGGPGTKTRLIAGLAYRFSKEVEVIADWQRFGFENPENTRESTLGSGLFLHVAATF